MWREHGVDDVSVVRLARKVAGHPRRRASTPRVSRHVVDDVVNRVRRGRLALGVESPGPDLGGRPGPRAVFGPGGTTEVVGWFGDMARVHRTGPDTGDGGGGRPAPVPGGGRGHKPEKHGRQRQHHDDGARAWEGVAAGRGRVRGPRHTASLPGSAPDSVRPDPSGGPLRCLPSICGPRPRVPLGPRNPRRPDTRDPRRPGRCHLAPTDRHRSTRRCATCRRNPSSHRPTTRFDHSSPAPNVAAAPPPAMRAADGATRYTAPAPPQAPRANPPAATPARPARRCGVRLWPDHRHGSHSSGGFSAGRPPAARPPDPERVPGR